MTAEGRNQPVTHPTKPAAAGFFTPSQLKLHKKIT